MNTLLQEFYFKKKCVLRFFWDTHPADHEINGLIYVT